MSRTLRWTWIVIAVLAVVLHMAMLDRQPLAPQEAMVALPALDAVSAKGWPATVASPLLLTGNAFLFWLFGPGDAIARTIPALGGCLWVLLPLLLRKRLGDIGSLTAASLLLFSPITLFASRRVDGAVLGVLGAALFLLALAAEDLELDFPLWAGACGLAIGLNSGPVFYDLLLPGVLIWAVYRRLSKTVTEVDWATKGWLVGIGFVAATLLAAGLGFRWSGWLDVGAGWVAWLRQWQGGIGNTLGLSLALYEPLLLLLGFLGLVWAFKEKQLGPLLLAAWSLLVLSLLTLRNGVSPTAWVAPILPLVLLAGWVMQQIMATEPAIQWLGEGLHIPLALLVWVHAVLALARYAYSPSRPGVELILFVLAVFIQVLFVAGSLSLTGQATTAWRGLLLSSVALLLLFQVSSGWRLSFSRADDLAEPLVMESTALDVLNFKHTVVELMELDALRFDTLKIALVKSTPETEAVLRWTLRDFSRVTVVESWPADDAGLVVTAVSGPVENVGAASGWRGSKFTVLLRQSRPLVSCVAPSFPICREKIKWYLYRQSNNPPLHEQIMLWVQP